MDTIKIKPIKSTGELNKNLLTICKLDFLDVVNKMLIHKCHKDTDLYNFSLLKLHYDMVSELSRRMKPEIVELLKSYGYLISEPKTDVEVTDIDGYVDGWNLGFSIDKVGKCQPTVNKKVRVADFIRIYIRMDYLKNTIEFKVV